MHVAYPAKQTCNSLQLATGGDLLCTLRCPLTYANWGPMIRTAASSLGRARASATVGPRATAIEAQDELSRRRGRGFIMYNSTTARPPTSTPTPMSRIATRSIDRRRRLPASFVANSLATPASRRLEVARSNRPLSSSATSGDGTIPSFSVLPPRAEEEAVGDAIADTDGVISSGGETPSSSLLSAIAADGNDTRGRHSGRTASPTTTGRGKLRPPHFLSPINRSEGLLKQPPMAILHNEYKHRWASEGRKDMLVNFDLDRCYTFNKMELDGKTLHHATFKCPETGCIFESGTPARSQDFLNLQGSASDFVTFTRSGDSSTAQSRNFYSSRSFAKNAAAARAIDCLSLREFRLHNGEDALPEEGTDTFRMCAEEPILLQIISSTSSILPLSSSPRDFMSPNDPGNYFLSPHLMPNTFSAKNFLHNMMQKFHVDLREKVASGFQSELIETDESGTEWWTAKYNDPLSGQTFEAGTLIAESPAEGTTYSSRIIDGNVCYNEAIFAERAAASRAIDCLSLREFQKQQGEDVIPEKGDVIRLCLEEPFTDFDYTSYEERNPIDDDTQTDSDYFMSARGRLASKRHYTSAKEFLFRNYSAYRRNYDAPQAFWNLNAALSSVTKGDGDGGDYWWTSTFKCPLSGEEFTSGTLREGIGPSKMRVIDSEVCYESQKLAEQAACARAVDILSFREFVQLRNEGSNVNEECIMKLCEEEPYLSALDRPGSVEETAKVTKKQPAAFRHIVLPPSLNVSNKPSMSAPLSKGVRLSDGVNLEPPGSSTSVPIPASGVFDDFDNAAEKFDDIADYDDDNDDDYIIHTLPVSFAISSSDVSSTNATAGLTTMERVLEAWIETPTATDSCPVVPIAKHSSLRSELLPPRSKSSTMVSISHALAWFNRLENGAGVSGETSTASKNSKFEQKYTIGTLLQMPVSVNSCNILLRALADANSRLTFAEQKQLSLDDTGFVLPFTSSTSAEKEERSGFIESIAKQLLERMHGTQNADGRSARTPSAETYNAYIGCLCRANPAETAAVAEAILMRMLDDNQTDIPRPNIDTFNSVIERWASVPGDGSRTKIKAIYSELLREGDRADAATCAEDTILTSSTLRPNRRTYLAAMSGLTQPPSEQQNEQFFSEQEARYWLEQMKSLAEECDDDTLLPDAEAYNAPLRWSGDPSSYWDNYSSIYKEGFQDDETADTINQEDAEATERWVLYMEELGRDNERLAPTLESYESVIQAWAKTGTYPGLLRAEQWAQRTLEAASLGEVDRIQPRLQTFHPIVASWAHCGYPERVQQWNDTLQELSSSTDGAMAGMTPDGRMQEALVIAWRKRQEISSSSRFAFDEPPSLQARLATSIEAANACAECLEQLCAQAKSQAGDRSDLLIAFDASTAERVIDAWADVAQLAATSSTQGLETDESGQSITPALALREMIRAVESVNEVIDVYRSTSMDGLDKKTSESYQYHMNHLLARTPQMYARAIRHIYDVDQIKRGGEGTESNHTIFQLFFPSVEKMLRRCHFYNIALIPLGPSHRKERREFRSENEVLVYRDSFSYSSSSSESSQGDKGGCDIASGHPLRDVYSAVLDNCTTMIGSVSSGDAFRLAMMVQKQLAIANRVNDGEEKDSKLHELAISVIDNLIEDDLEKSTIRKKLKAPEGHSEVMDDEENNFVDAPSSGKISSASTSFSAPVEEENGSLSTRKTKKRVIVKRRFPVSSGRRTTRGIKRRR